MHLGGFPVIRRGGGMLATTVMTILSSVIILSVAAEYLSAQVQVLDYREINSQENLADHPVDLDGYMGMALTSLGDLDGDGIEEIAVGAREGLYIIFPDSSGFAKSYVRINSIYGGFTGGIEYNDQFGYALEAIGDLDNDGMVDLAIGASGDDDGYTNRGAVWILFLNTDCTVKSYQKISDTEGDSPEPWTTATSSAFPWPLSVIMTATGSRTWPWEPGTTMTGEAMPAHSGYFSSIPTVRSSRTRR